MAWLPSERRGAFALIVEGVLTHAPHLDQPRLSWDAALLAQTQLGRAPTSGPYPRRATWRQVLQHLLGPYPVPAFLLDDVADAHLGIHRIAHEQVWKVHAAAAIAQGRSFDTLIGDRALPVPLTRRMVHLFVNHRTATTTAHAARAAQVRGRGGHAFVLDALLNSPLAVIQPRDGLVNEAWVAELIDWMCRTRDVVGRGLADTVRGLVGLRREGVPVDVSGRSYASVRRTTKDYLARVAARGVPAGAPTGYLASAWEDADGAWSVVTLERQEQLVEESQHMRHCAHFYGRLVRNGSVALLSLRLDGHRLLTMEVVRASSTLIQVKGFANRPPTPEESAQVRRWAAQHQLRVLPTVLR